MLTYTPKSIRSESFEIGGTPHQVVYFKERLHPLSQGPKLPYFWLWGHDHEIERQPPVRMNKEDVKREIEMRGAPICCFTYIHFDSKGYCFWLSENELEGGVPFAGVSFILERDLKKRGLSSDSSSKEVSQELIREKLSILNYGMRNPFYGFQINKMSDSGELSEIFRTTGFRGAIQAEKNLDVLLEVMREPLEDVSPQRRLNHKTGRPPL